jgi:hypothetical protein
VVELSQAWIPLGTLDQGRDAIEVCLEDNLSTWNLGRHPTAGQALR